MQRRIASSCTDAALDIALSGGGLVTFDCGGPATIDVSTGTRTKTTSVDTAIDGGSVTDGGHNIDDGTMCGFTDTGCTSTSGSSSCNTNPLLDPAGLANNGGPTQTITLCTGPGAPSAGCTGGSPAINGGNESVG